MPRGRGGGRKGGYVQLCPTASLPGQAGRQLSRQPLSPGCEQSSCPLSTVPSPPALAGSTLRRTNWRLLLNYLRGRWLGYEDPKLDLQVLATTASLPSCRPCLLPPIPVHLLAGWAQWELREQEALCIHRTPELGTDHSLIRAECTQLTPPPSAHSQPPSHPTSKQVPQSECRAASGAGVLQACRPPRKDTR